MQVALWTWGYRIACKAWFAMGANMPVEQLQERHSVRLGRVVRKLIEDIRRPGLERPRLVGLVAAAVVT